MLAALAKLAQQAVKCQKLDVFDFVLGLKSEL